MSVAEPWLVTSRQRWKLMLALPLVVIPPLAETWWLLTNQQTWRGDAAAFGAFALGVAVALSVRCRVCGERIVWWVVARESAGSWIPRLRLLRACPTCGDPGDGSKPLAAQARRG